jgi:hypothetical protein
MSETPPKPDGSDPRVLTPDDDEPDVKVAKENTEAFHTADCRTIYRLRDRSDVGFTTRKRSVAEWQGLHECEICRREGEYDPDDRPDPTPDEGTHTIDAATCDALRTYLGSGMDAVEIIDIVPYGETVVREHLKGKCDHDTDAPAYSFGWHPATDPPEATEAVDRSRVEAQTCYALRDRLLDGQPLKDASDALRMNKGTARKHAKGRCPHRNSTPPLERGWYVDD